LLRDVAHAESFVRHLAAHATALTNVLKVPTPRHQDVV
jgi:hypothetical protein